ncbi:flavin reductase family protein [Salinispora pacifica]|uniref:flavin reductase family protein n=1 Tax=Salinispora pacifica TaxID=351187 RepID=UPI00036F5A0C|nr:flavin reductase family protein [Salinispora pacifica]
MDQTPIAVAAPDAAGFRRAMGLFPTGVSIVTTGSGDSTSALTINAVTAVSLDPLLVLVSIGATGRMRFRIEAESVFGLSMLTDRQAGLCRTFARSDRPEGTAATHLLGATGPVSGVTLVEDALTALECRVHDRVDGGDHVLFLGRVVAIHDGENSARPLVFHRGRYVRIGLPLRTDQ